jgi:hypothetical protein
MKREIGATNPDGQSPARSIAGGLGNPSRVPASIVMANRRWRSSMVEQLICNQQVAGSSPIASSAARDSHGGIPERSKGTDCKSVATGFEGSNPSPSTNTGKLNPHRMNPLRRMHAGVAQLVELQPSKLVVAGSRPVSRSAHVAQLAEHVLGKDEVTRSIRVVGSRPNRVATQTIRQAS